MNGREAAQGILEPPHLEEKSLATPTPIDLLRMAVSQGADIDKLEKLMALQERWEANEAKKAFFEAMNAFKNNPPSISKNRHVHFGQTEYNHATLDHVCDQITKALSQHGITHRWKVEQEQQLIKVTCILSKGIHSEETTLSGSPDTTGSKNSIQAIGSTVTYLQRYTLLAATGLAASNGDNDGAGEASNGDVSEQCEWIANASTMEELQKLYKQAYVKFDGNKNAQYAVIAAKDKRKKELQ